jgi:hypothetical protein
MYEFNEIDLPKVTRILTEEPLSLMDYPKREFMIDYINKFNVSNMLEIGTFAAGTAYVLAKAFPNKSITTVDVNNFEHYFTIGDHSEHLKTIQSNYPKINIRPDSITKIQQIYKNECPNITLVEGDWRLLDVSSFDFIIVDGNHDIDVVLSDLTYAYDNIKLPGIIMVDDCVFPYIKDIVVNFCKEHNLEVAFECEDSKYNQEGEIITGPDLAIIHITKR